MTDPVQIRPYSDIDWLVMMLAAADEDAGRVRAIVSDSANNSYAVITADGTPIGALTMRWADSHGEILYIALAAARRGGGIGKIVLARVADEARRRGVSVVRVGTANSSLDNIAFYQKCGFRMEAVRRDFFAYLPEPVYENGIRIRDMLVLCLDIAASP